MTGGAEKQMTYMARSLTREGIDVRVLCFTKGDYFEGVLRGSGIPVDWVGRPGLPGPFGRALAVRRYVNNFNPHIVQATHFYTNLYAGVAVAGTGAISIGAIRSDLERENKEHGIWTPLLLRLPTSLIANSRVAWQAARQQGVTDDRVFCLDNAIDIPAFDETAQQTAGDLPGRREGKIVAAVVANLIPLKKVERFLEALVEARRQVPDLVGWVVGEGRARAALEDRARELGLSANEVAFLGRRDDIPSILKQADLLVVTSDHEGVPNAILEAMAARLPVVTTPAGDAPTVVQDGISGFIVPFEPREGMVQRLVELAGNPELRERMGSMGRRSLEQRFSVDTLGGRLLEIYRRTALLHAHRRVLEALG
jgi:glycosyltransferase involved in cell wall biosynthesis